MPKRRKLALSDLKFPGCYSRPMTLAEYQAYEGKIEFFDSSEELAGRFEPRRGPRPRATPRARVEDPEPAPNHTVTVLQLGTDALKQRVNRVMRRPQLHGRFRQPLMRFAFTMLSAQ